MLVLLLASGYNALDNGDQGNLRYALAGGSAGFAATAFGALLAIGLRTVSQRTQDSLLGFAAGMMLAAASFSLILPGWPPARRSWATAASLRSPWYSAWAWGPC